MSPPLQILRGIRRILNPSHRQVDDPLAVFTRLSEADRRELLSPYDPGTPLPDGIERILCPNHPRLKQLRRDYAALNLPVITHSRWNDHNVSTHLDLRYFRGENPFVWHWRELPRATRLKFFIYLKYLQERDSHGLLNRLTEDGAFGCWTYDYPGYPRVSRDLLDSVNELQFLDRALGIFSRPSLRVLDIGAGYGRLAHRMTEALPNLVDYCCVDAIPESSFLCEYYLGYRACVGRARVVTLGQVTTELQPAMFDLAVNIHSFSECTYSAVEWWVGQLRRLRIPTLMIVPNEPIEFLTTEADGSKRNFASLLESAGYRAVTHEPVFLDPAVRELMRIDDHFHLFRLTDA